VQSLIISQLPRVGELIVVFGRANNSKIVKLISTTGQGVGLGRMVTQTQCLVVKIDKVEEIRSRDFTLKFREKDRLSFNCIGEYVKKSQKLISEMPIIQSSIPQPIGFNDQLQILSDGSSDERFDLAGFQQRYVWPRKGRINGVKYKECSRGRAQNVRNCSWSQTARPVWSYMLNCWFYADGETVGTKKRIIGKLSDWGSDCFGKTGVGPPSKRGIEEA